MQRWRESQEEKRAEDRALGRSIGESGRSRGARGRETEEWGVMASSGQRSLLPFSKSQELIMTDMCVIICHRYTLY